MESKLLYRLICLSVFASNTCLAAEKYGFETDVFQLGQWTRKDLSYERGIEKLKTIDNWFYSLPVVDREKYLDDYTLNRNRLFLVTQEKRIVAVMQPTMQQTVFGASDASKSVKQEQSQQLTAIRQMSDALINDSESLKKGLFNSLNDIAKALPSKFNGAAARLGNSFSKSLSKSSHSAGFGQAYSKLGSGDVEGRLSELQSMRLDQLLDLKGCRVIEKCNEHVKKFLTGVMEKQKAMDELKSAQKKSAQKEKVDLIIQKPFCQSLETKVGALADTFDSKKSPKTAKFLADLKVPLVESQWKSNDLSSWYGEPTTQWNEIGTEATATCAGHAIASNVMAAQYKNKLIKIRGITKPNDISPDQAYAMAKHQEIKREGVLNATVETPDPSVKGYCDPAAYGINPYEGMQNMVAAMTVFKTVPLCTKSQSQTTKDLFQIEKFSAAEFGPSDKKPGFEFFKALIDSGNPPIVGVDSDSRIESAGWLTITSGGRFTHVMNVVGYDEGVDPMTLCPTKFFIVRDSMGKQKIHYKVAAENLLEHLDGVYHATKVLAVDGTVPSTVPAAGRSAVK
jgi:hypothetical protein